MINTPQTHTPPGKDRAQHVLVCREAASLSPRSFQTHFVPRAALRKRRKSGAPTRRHPSCHTFTPHRSASDWAGSLGIQGLILAGDHGPSILDAPKGPHYIE